MNIIYLHGLDSGIFAKKAQITKQFAAQFHVPVFVPDLNCPPDLVLEKILSLVNDDSVLIGSSLGGYFAHLVQNKTGAPAVLLNPSIAPHISFQRFLASHDIKGLQDDSVVYRTKEGWDVLYKDLAWFKRHLLAVLHPKKLRVCLSMDDELLSAQQTKQFYEQGGAYVSTRQKGGHVMSDYDGYVADVFMFAKQLHKSIKRS